MKDRRIHTQLHR